MKRLLYCILLLFLTLTPLFSQEAVIINKTGFDIYNIYLSPSGMEQWSKDLLPNDVILSNQYKVLDLSSYEDEFIFDFRFIDVDGDEYIKKNVDLNLHRKMIEHPVAGCAEDLPLLTPRSYRHLCFYKSQNWCPYTRYRNSLDPL